MVFGTASPEEAFSKAEALCARLIAARVPLDQKAHAKEIVGKLVNRKNADQAMLWTLASLLRTDQQHVAAADCDLLLRLEKRDERISLEINKSRRHAQFDSVARWVLGELVRHAATSTDGLNKAFGETKLEAREVNNIVREFAKQRFENVMTRLVEVANEGSAKWVSPRIITEQILVGALGGGDWFRDHTTPPILLWKKPIKAYKVSFNKDFIDNFSPKVWPLKYSHRIGRPKSKRGILWVEVELLDWLGSIWVEANLSPGFWKDNSRNILSAFAALEKGGAFILRNATPSPRGKKYVDQFVFALAAIRDDAAKCCPSANFKLWFDWEWDKSYGRASFKNVQSTNDAFDEVANTRYEKKLDEAYGYQCEMAKLLRAGHSSKIDAFIKALERKKVPPYLISDWIKYPTILD